MKIAAIGCGLRTCTVLKSMCVAEIDFTLCAVCDRDFDYAKGQLEKFGVPYTDTRFFTDADEMLDAMSPDGVIIGTNCDSHTEEAIRVMKRNIPMLLEKPVSITLDQVRALYRASKDYKSQALVSFPLRGAPILQLVRDIVQSGEIGEIQQVQATNNVPYGRVYYRSWYRDDSRTGGLFLQKATHDIDYINYVLGLYPRSVCATESKQIFKGDKPAGLKCVDCPEYKTCPESSYNVLKRCLEEDAQGDYCVFGVDVGNHDMASMLLEYPEGKHAVYSQNFFVRKDAKKRGARFIGYKGTIDFDFYTSTATVYSHMLPKVSTHHLDTAHLPHFGGDTALSLNFAEIIAGGRSMAPLEAGIMSALSCLTARESVKTRSFCDLELV